MRVVVDTNVFVSSFFGGHPRRIIDLWKEGRIIICLSPQIVEEYIEVLRRIGLEGEDELGELILLLRGGYNLLFTTRTPRLDIFGDDPEDNKFIECAVALKAEAVITGDKGMLKLREYLGISILTPKEFLAKLE